MSIRTALIGAMAFALSATSASAQGKAPQKAVLSASVLKSMAANKPKSKKPLSARFGMVRRSSVTAAKPAPAAPTSVREIRPVSRKQ